MLKAVIFDMDGVIIDSEPLYFEIDKMVCRKFGIELTNEYLFRYVGISNPVMWKEIIEDIKIDSSVEELIRLKTEFRKVVFSQSIKEPIGGIRELLEDLKLNGIKIAVASSSERSLINEVLEKLDISSYYDVICSGEEMERGKPFPDIFLKTAELLEVSPGECAVIEDSVHGVAGAIAAGMATIGFANPSSGNQDLSQATCVVEDIKVIDYEFISGLI